MDRPCSAGASTATDPPGAVVGGAVSALVVGPPEVVPAEPVAAGAVVVLAGAVAVGASTGVVAPGVASGGAAVDAVAFVPLGAVALEATLVPSGVIRPRAVALEVVPVAPSGVATPVAAVASGDVRIGAVAGGVDPSAVLDLASVVDPQVVARAGVGDPFEAVPCEPASRAVVAVATFSGAADTSDGVDVSNTVKQIARERMDLMAGASSHIRAAKSPAASPAPTRYAPVRMALRINGTLDPPGSPWYERLFADQLCTVIIACGFDEYGANRSQDELLESGLVARGFSRDDAGALARIAAGKRVAPQRPAEHWIAGAAATDAAGRPVDVVVTLVRAGDGSAGGDAASAFLDGLGRCDVAMYGGHGRYGTGPDFDYNFTADLVDDKGAIEASFSEYKDLEEFLAERGRATRRSPLAEYRALVAKGRLQIRRVNSGNLVINLRNYHTAEFGAHVMVDQLKTDPNIRRMSKQAFDRRYRLWLFNGCRTNDYFYNLRKLNPKANAGGLDLIGTRRVTYWSMIGDTMLKLLDELLQRRTFSQILQALHAVNPDNPGDDARGPSHVADLGRRA